jgi:hypothetical protein
VLLLFTALQLVALPPKRFPVIFKVPVELTVTPTLLAAPPEVIFPTMLAVDGEAAEKANKVEVLKLLFVTFAVNVTPLLST